MTDKTDGDITIGDDFNIEDEETRAELGLPPIDEGDIPDTLKFSTRTDKSRRIERRTVEIDGQRFILTRPSDGALWLFVPKLTSPDAQERFEAMMRFLDVCLDRAGVQYLIARMTDPANDYDDELIPTIVATVLDLWGEKTVAEMWRKLNAAKAEQGDVVPINRQQRRAQARKRPAKKAPAKKAPAKK